ncbi:hypothetical protein COV17_01365 [Candidatus Woesearchaeota archaeon CG10_big_fil_rev_8_21_14_0_10_36_11]|nr:MAG: hypothetical protein COV17_01365 [Candidatus Woesearchaeota archaeon CG10_big_fil_rev_8_21_14_0_10_36_11]
MKISLTKDIFTAFNPKFALVCILVKKMDNKQKIEESKHLLAEAENLVHFTFHKETIKNHHMISPWAVAQEEFGKSAMHYHTSVEKLLKKVLRTKSVATKNVLENVLSYIALKHIVPFGFDDLDKFIGDITFSVATGKEKKGVLRLLQKGELYYRDEKAVLGTKLDYWKSTRTSLHPKTTTALIHIDVLPPITQKAMKLLIKETTELVESFTGGKTKVFVLDKNKKTITV